MVGCMQLNSDKNSIRAVERKANKKAYKNIDAHVSSAAKLDFIEDETVDFVLADGLLCCVGLQDHPGAVSEIKRIMKPGGKALLITSTSSASYVDDQEWESILAKFTGGAEELSTLPARPTSYRNQTVNYDPLPEINLIKFNVSGEIAGKRLGLGCGMCWFYNHAREAHPVNYSHACAS